MAITSAMCASAFLIFFSFRTFLIGSFHELRRILHRKGSMKLFGWNFSDSGCVKGYEETSQRVLRKYQLITTKENHNEG
jgi:hypothetical protein